VHLWKWRKKYGEEDVEGVEGVEGVNKKKGASGDTNSVCRVMTHMSCTLGKGDSLGHVWMANESVKIFQWLNCVYKYSDSALPTPPPHQIKPIMHHTQNRVLQS
jgi:hypothetical protein